MVAKAKHEVSRSIPTRITKGGQITLPAEAREVLGVKVGDTVQIHIVDSTISIVRPKYRVSDLKGIIKRPTRTEDFEEQIRDAQEDMLDKQSV